LLSANPQAYDELKKRLLSEYKKLVSTKKAFEPQDKILAASGAGLSKA